MDELLKILTELRPEVDFTQGDLTEDGILESMDIMLILDALEQHYGIEFAPTDIVPENFDTVEAMLELVNRVKGN